MRYLPLAVALACLGLYAAPEKYTGPRPPKPDVPYLVHADNLIATETTEAKEEPHGKETAYIVAGASSPARTPMAEPIFLLQSENIKPEDLQLYKFEVKDGRREVMVSPGKKGAKPLRLMVTSLGEGLYRLEVNVGLGLENGQYGLSPSGVNTVFCFEVY